MTQPQGQDSSADDTADDAPDPSVAVPPVKVTGLALLLTPCAVLGGVGWLAGGAVLLFYGFWRLLLSGVFSFVMMDFIFPLLLMPVGICVNLSQVFKAGGRARVATGLYFAGTVFLALMLGIWVLAVFALTAAVFSAGHIWLAAGWAVCQVVTPLAVFARRDRGNVFFAAAVLAVAVAAVCCALGLVFGVLHGLGQVYLLSVVVIGCLTGGLQLVEHVKARGGDVAASG